MRKVLLGLAAVLGALVVIVLLVTLSTGSRQIDVDPAPPVAIDVDAAARRLAGALQIETISHEDPAELDTAAFLRFHEYLAANYPRVHERLQRETVHDLSLFYRWQGRNSDAEPIVLLSHFDVVPVVPGTEDRWDQPPFSGAIADGFVWGRGALDDKFGVMAILDAVELLLGENFTPERTVYLAFGHDEEVGGPNGAVAMAELLKSRGVRAAFVLDEGGAILKDVVPGVASPVAAIGIAEKGSVTLGLRAEAEGGHSSTPPRHTAIGIVSRAVTRLEDNQMPGELRGAALKFFEFVGPEMSLPLRAALANRWLFGTPIAWMLEGNPATNATLRTTTAATIIEGGVKSNVLPTDAEATVNFRILPGDSIQDVVDHARAVIDDEQVEIEVHEGAREPSEVSPTDSDAFALLQRTISSVYPSVVVAPFLTVGGTDSRHYAILTPNVYRFTPIIGRRDDLARMHGTNERVAVDEYGQAIGFFVTLLRNANDF